MQPGASRVTRVASALMPTATPSGSSTPGAPVQSMLVAANAIDAYATASSTQWVRPASTSVLTP